MIISTKGVSVTAARRLVDEVCGENDIPLLVLHDFDVAGFMIFGTLQRDTRRYEFANGVEPIDLGLRLEDIDGLEQEPAAATKTNVEDLRQQLVKTAPRTKRSRFLLDNRVELNAMASDQLIAFIERKLEEHGIQQGRARRGFARRRLSGIPSQQTIARDIRGSGERIRCDRNRNRIVLRTTWNPGSQNP